MSFCFSSFLFFRVLSTATKHADGVIVAPPPPLRRRHARCRVQRLWNRAVVCTGSVVDERPRVSDDRIVTYS